MAISMVPANGFEPMPCALRVRLREVSHHPQSLLSRRIRKMSRPLRPTGIPKTPDGGECAPRVPQRKDRVRIADRPAASFVVLAARARYGSAEAKRPVDEQSVRGVRPKIPLTSYSNRVQLYSE